MDDLHDQMMAAHGAGDTAALVRLYTRAADAAPDEDAACFFLTHAFVFALSMDHSATKDLNGRLVAHGRDHALPEEV